MSGAAVALETAYYRTVEEFFVERRGPPLVISNADWTLVRRWRRAGLPLRVVLRGIADALDAHAHSFARDQPVSSLRYCEAEVELARERWQRALAGAGPTDLDLGAGLEALAQGCQAARERLPPVLARRLDELTAALRARACDPGARIDLETWLAAEEAELVKRLCRAAGGAELRARLEVEIEADLVPYRQRLPAPVLKQVRTEALARRVLEEHGLPRLSLFA